MLRITRINSRVGMYRLIGVIGLLTVIAFTVSILMLQYSTPASAVTTVPTRMNFQGRLADSTGNIKANGTYNMRLRLFTAASGGTAVWTEDRLVSAGQGVTLTNGLFALQLGSVTSLPASLFASGALYLEVELPTPATATSASPTWTEGAMTPRNQMATSAYAYNSELLDGLDGDYYRDATNLNAGTLNSARITGAYANMTGTGALVSGSIANGFGTIATANTIQGSRFISTVATGTAPLTVASTTKVANLNSDLLDDQDSSYYTNIPARLGYTPSRSSSSTNSIISLDTRAVNQAPQDRDLGLYVDFKQNSTDGLSDGGTYHGVLTFRSYGTASDLSGGNPVQIANTANGNLFIRTGTSATTWGSWTKVWTDANDGSGSGLDADTLDGLSSAAFLTSSTGVQLQAGTPGTAQTGNINVSGAVIASSFSGSGSGLTNLSASNLTSGTLADARLSARLGQYAQSISDWNTAQTNGWYMGYNIANSPTANTWYIGEVVAHNSLWVTQTVWLFTDDSSTNTQMWRRDSSDVGGVTTWGAWYKLQVSQAEQDARYASISGSSNYIQNTTSPQSANFNVTGNGTIGGALTAGAQSNFGTTSTCCGANYTLAVSEATSSNSRLPTIQFHTSGFQEGFIRLASSSRTFEFGDTQNAGASIAALNGAGTRQVFLNPVGTSYFQGGNVAIGTTSTSYKLDVQGGDINTSGVLRGASAAISGSATIGGTLAVGGSITAGNITAVGGLQVQQTANFGDSVYMGSGDVARSLSVGSASAPVWTARSSTYPGGNGWSSITYGNGLYVAVTYNGVATSPDGVTWTNRTPANANDWNAVTYGNGLFVAVAMLAPDDNAIMTSPDGITWTLRNIPGSSFEWSSITYGNGKFVAVDMSGGGNLLTSSDGINWTLSTTLAFDYAMAVTYGNGKFVAVSQDHVGVSTDGLTWTRYLTPTTNDQMTTVTYGNGIFVAMTYYGRVLTSPDGATWTLRSAAESNQWQSVTYGNGMFVAVSANGANRIMTSMDGVSWKGQVATAANSWRSVAYGNGRFVAVSTNGTNRIMTSDDRTGAEGALQVAGTISATDSIIATASSTSAFRIQAEGSSLALLNADTASQTISIGTALNTSGARLYIEAAGGTESMKWTLRSAAQANDWRSVAYGNGKFVAVSANGSNRVMTSVDGTTWVAQTAAQANSWKSVAYGNGVFVAVSSDGTNRVMTSPDGSNWTVRTAAQANSWTDVTYGRGGFVAVSPDGTNRVMTSPDGITWTARSAASVNPWTAVTYGDGKFVAISQGVSSVVMTSTDGFSWTSRTAPSATYASIAHGDGLFVAVSNEGGIISSPDGISWTSRTSVRSEQFDSVTYGNGIFVAVTLDSSVETSSDGIIWEDRTDWSAAGGQWSSVTYGNGKFVAVSTGVGNIVMTSGDVALSTRGSVQVTGDISSTGNIETSAALKAGGLEVSNWVESGYAATISNTAFGSNTADGLLIQINTGNGLRGTGNYFVGFAGTGGTVAGKIQGGANAVAYTTTGADYAEYFKADPANMPQPGELVALDTDTPNGVELASGTAAVMGVVSTNPGFVGNGPLCNVGDEDCDANYAKTNALVSLVGQVPVKVTGDVKLGDMLGASDTPGVAQKVTSGSYVGYALTPDEDGMAQVLIRPGVVNASTAVQGGDATFTSIITSGPATVDSLTVVGDAVVKGDIYVEGHLVSRGGAPTIDTALVNCVDEIQITGTDIAGTIQFKVNEAGCSSADLRFNFAKAYSAAPNATLTAKDRDSARLQSSLDASTDKMTFSFDSLQIGKTYRFTYHVIQ